MTKPKKIQKKKVRKVHNKTAYQKDKRFLQDCLNKMAHQTVIFSESENKQLSDLDVIKHFDRISERYKSDPLRSSELLALYGDLQVLMTLEFKNESDKETKNDFMLNNIIFLGGFLLKTETRKDSIAQLLDRYEDDMESVSPFKAKCWMISDLIRSHKETLKFIGQSKIIKLMKFIGIYKIYKYLGM